MTESHENPRFESTDGSRCFRNRFHMLAEMEKAHLVVIQNECCNAVVRIEPAVVEPFQWGAFQIQFP